MLPLPIKAAIINQKSVDKKLLAGTITVSLIILIFGAFMYNTFGAPIVREVHTKVSYQIKEPQIEKSLQPYVGVYNTLGIFKGTVSWLGLPQDSTKQLNNINLVSYACIVDRSYSKGHLWSATVELHVAVSKNKFILPNDIIGYEEAVIPVLGVDTPKYQFNFNFSTAVNGVEKWYE